MKLIDGSINRCAIFLYYDKEGIVDDYVIYLLNDLKKNINDLLIVCNGAVTPESEDKFRTLTDNILIRANKGFDVGGYREGLFHIGFDKLMQYDEVVLLNYTFFGPLYPFSEMFDEMAKRDLDFWGITNHFEVNPDPFGQNRYGIMPEHLQSHFLVVRKSLLNSNEYREFMINMKNPDTYVDSICDYESIFQRHFKDLGFHGEAYCDASEYKDYVYNPVMFRLKEMIINQRCPIVKRRSFFTDYNDFLLNSCGEVTAEAYKYIREHLDYDVNLVWDNLLRLENMTEINRAMQLNYMLPEKECLQEECPYQKVGIYVVLDSTKHVDDYMNYLQEIPDEISIWVVGTADKLEDKTLRQFVEKRKNCNAIESITDLWIEMLQKLISNAAENHYEFIAIAEIKDYEQYQPYSNRISWQYSDWKNTVASAAFIRNIVATFEQNERMGMLIPPVPNYGNIFEMIQNGWMGKYQEVVDFLHMYSIKANIKEQDEPLAPYGGSFWMRTNALKYILDLQFDKMLDKKDVQLMAMPFLVQNGGYYTGTAYNMEYASISVTNQDYMFRETNKAVFQKYGPSYHKVVVERIKQGSVMTALSRKARIKLKMKQIIKKYMPNKAYVIGKKIYRKMKQ